MKRIDGERKKLDGLDGAERKAQEERRARNHEGHNRASLRNERTRLVNCKEKRDVTVRSKQQACCSRI